MKYRPLHCGILFSLVAACVDPYELDTIPAGEDYLVIDGFINSGEGPTTFKLSHLLNLYEEGNGRPEVNAEVTVESSTGESFLLPEMDNGEYSAEHPVNADNQYRLRIKTTTGKEYLSDFTEVKYTPPIDSIFWELDFHYRELNLYVATHDPTNQARYYQWEFEETYQFRSYFRTKFEYIDGEIVWNPFLEIYDCWKTIPSTTLLTATSNRLKEDVISKFYINRVIPESEKIKLRYSILVKQYALTPDAYLYIEELKKYTELSGSIFDPIPSRIPGNIKCISHPDEPAVGFISCYNVQEKRLFITPQSPLPVWFQTPYVFCPEGAGIVFQPGQIRHFLELGWVLPVGLFPGAPISYVFRSCVDCRSKKAPHDGGTNIKPDFWP